MSSPRIARSLVPLVGAACVTASLFAAQLFRMYARYAEMSNWRVEVLSSSAASGMGGFKEVIAMIEGQGAYSRLKYESGVHRVQRVPVTEAQGRIHTSAVTVAVLPPFKVKGAVGETTVKRGLSFGARPSVWVAVHVANDADQPGDRGRFQLEEAAHCRLGSGWVLQERRPPAHHQST